MTSIDRPAASSAPDGPGAPPPRGDVRRLRIAALGAAVASATLAGLGLLWTVAPGSAPLDDGMPTLGAALLGPTAVAAVTVAVGIAGLVLAAFVATRDRPAHGRPIALAAAAVAVVTAPTLGSVSTVALAGYLFGLAAVVAGLATIAVMLVRSPRLGWALLAGLAAVVVSAFWWAGLTLDGIAQFGAAFAGALVESSGVLLATAAVLAMTLLWATVSVLALRSDGGAPVVETWLVRHRRLITILAALGPLPYALARASWLTPWPLFGPGADELEPAMLATGLMLGSGAVAASILTLGLILPWGRTFPRWLPRVGGRPVPVAAVAVPGFVAAGILCVSAAPMFAMSLASPASPIDAVLLNLVLPLWFWGPTLALAVWAYLAWRRRDEASAAGPSRGGRAMRG